MRNSEIHHRWRARLVLGAAGLVMVPLLACVAFAQDVPGGGEIAPINAAYTRGAASGLSPQSEGEMAMCHFYWERWEQHLASVPAKAMLDGLNPALSAKSAKRKKAQWLKQARATYRKYEGSLDGIDRMLARQAERADASYADFMHRDPKRGYALIETLGTCK